MEYGYFVGIDVSKDSFSIAILNKTGEIIREENFSQTHREYGKFVTILHNTISRDKIVIAIESSGNYHINLLSYLISKSYHVVLINPLLLKNFRDSTTLRKTKTDKIDAVTIAKFIFKNPENIKKFLPDESVKLIAREREEIAKEVAKIKTKIKGLVFNVFKELGDIVDVLNKKILNFLLLVPSVRVAREIGKEEVRKRLERAFSGKGKSPDITAEDIMKITQETISIDDIEREVVLQSLIRRLLYLEQEMEKLTFILLERVKFFRSREMSILTSIPGIGELSAATFIAEIQNISRFPSHKKLIAYIGLDPIILESGKYKGRFRISKRGNPHLRRIIWSITIGAIFHTQIFREYYKRKRNNGFRHKKAVIATANKLIRIIYSLLTYERAFNPSPHFIPPNSS